MTIASDGPSKAKSWMLATRPRTLGASLIPVLVGSAAAHGEGLLSWPVAGACAAAALLLQVAANLANDALDFADGIDTKERRGPPRATQSGWLRQQHVLGAAGAALVLASAPGFYLVQVGGLPILMIGIFAAVCAVAYSGGPFPLASHGLGELAAFLFFGVIAVVGTTYLHTGALSTRALLASLPVAALVSALMLVNNLRDVESDAQTGKRTLAVRIGADRTRALYAALLMSAYMAPGVLWLTVQVSPSVWLPLLTLPLAWREAAHLRRARRGDEFNVSLAGTARLHAIYGLLLAGGLWP